MHGGAICSGPLAKSSIDNGVQRLLLDRSEGSPLQLRDVREHVSRQRHHVDEIGEVDEARGRGGRSSCCPGGRTPSRTTRNLAHARELPARSPRVEIVRVQVEHGRRGLAYQVLDLGELASSRRRAATSRVARSRRRTASF